MMALTSVTAPVIAVAATILMVPVTAASIATIDASVAAFIDVSVSVTVAVGASLAILPASGGFPNSVWNSETDKRIDLIAPFATSFSGLAPAKSAADGSTVRIPLPA